MSKPSDKATPDAMVADFLNAFKATDDYRRELVAELSALATSDDPKTAEPATTALFASLVERLADSFSPADVALYNRVFAQVIEHCRRLPTGHAIDAALNHFGLRDEAALINRAESLRHRKAAAHFPAASVRRIVVLSRVTLGADVAITSRIINRCERQFPDAEIVLVGGRKAAELFGGDPRITFKEIAYRRGGLTMERLLSWLDVIDVTRELTAHLSPGEWLIVDPDSRLTQLGLLPLTEREANYLFFPSREYGATTAQSLGQLTSAWLDEVFGAPQTTLSCLSLRRKDLDRAGALVAEFRQASKRPIVTVNFGVGENPAKRVGGDFEPMLVAELIRQGATVFFDKGAGAEEARRASTVIDYADDAASAVECEPSDARLLVYNVRIGMLAALIAQSDLYVGYDSAGQHIAAAAGTPCIDVFAGYSSARMLDRWRPAGLAASEIVVVEPSHTPDEVLSATLAAVARLLTAGH